MMDTEPLSLSLTRLNSRALPQHLLQKKEAAMREESMGTTSEVPCKTPRVDWGEA